MDLNSLINDLKEAWEEWDDSIYNIEDIDSELRKWLSQISDIDLREQIIDYFWEEITSW